MCGASTEKIDHIIIKQVEPQNKNYTLYSQVFTCSHC